MAFKRSAVRSRLSPPKSFEILGFRSFFFCKSWVLGGFWGVFKLTRKSPFLRKCFDHNTDHNSGSTDKYIMDNFNLRLIQL